MKTTSKVLIALGVEQQQSNLGILFARTKVRTRKKLSKNCPTIIQARLRQLLILLQKGNYSQQRP